MSHLVSGSFRYTGAPASITAAVTADSADLHPAQSRRNFQRLFMLRCVIYCGQAGAIVGAGFWLGAPPSTAALAVVLGALLAFNLLSWRHLFGASFCVQLLGDVAALSLLLYFTGGATNPFGWLLLLSITIAATVLPKMQTWLVALTSIGAYSLLMLFYQPLPDVHPAMGSGFGLHVVGMWLGFILSAVLIAHFVAGMAANVRARDAALARAREQALRDERIVSLGALAASAAHELGTPLGTLAVLAEELALDFEDGAVDAVNGKLKVMRDQIRRCKQAIAGIASAAGAEAAQGGRAVDIAAFIETTVGEWRARRGGIAVRCCVNPAAPRLRLVAEQNLASALANIFDNAADASPDDVEIHADWDSEALAVRVEDRGPGFAPELRARVGKSLFSAKAEGHGIGLYLSQGIIDRVGGKLRIQPRAGGGTTVEVQLPLAGLMVS